MAEGQGGDLELKYLGRSGGDAITAYDALSPSPYKRRLLFQGIYATRVQQCVPLPEAQDDEKPAVKDAKPNPKNAKKG